MAAEVGAPFCCGGTGELAGLLMGGSAPPPALPHPSLIRTRTRRTQLPPPAGLLDGACISFIFHNSPRLEYGPVTLPWGSTCQWGPTEHQTVCACPGRSLPGGEGEPVPCSGSSHFSPP